MNTVDNCRAPIQPDSLFSQFITPQMRAEDICIQTAELINPKMTAAERLWMSRTITEVLAEKRENVCIRARQFITSEMGAADRVEIIDNIGWRIHSLELEDVCNRAVQTVQLINPRMGATERIAIILAISSIVPTEREDVDAQANRFITLGMSVADRVGIMNAINGILFTHRSDVCDRAIQLINPQMGSAERVMTICNIKNLFLFDRLCKPMFLGD